MEISPAGFEHYLPLFDYLIESLKKLSEKYNKSTKANKSSQLLNALVSNLEEELKFSAKVEPNSRSGGLLKMTRQLTGNLAITTTLDFENYEKRCKEMAEAEKLIPSIVENEYMKPIFYKTSRWKVNSDDLIEVKPSLAINEENIKMVYENVDPSIQKKLESIDEESYDTEVINSLKKYGFMYYVRQQTLVILLNSKFWLLIEKNKLYHFEFYKSDGYYELQKGVAYYHVHNSNLPQKIDKELLLKLLKYLSIASMSKNGSEGDYKKFVGYEPWWFLRKGALPILFNKLLEYCLPEGYFYINQNSLDTRVFTDKEAKEGFLWKSDTPDWIGILINVIEHYGDIISLPNIWNDAHLKDIKVTR
ncbi:MAG: hypothetical protein J1D77_04420 [Muribaculaceae bacterium]|nr:hypothetical protein [Muribaculaceae bacterium]